MTAPRPCPPAPGPLESYAVEFDPLFGSLGQRRSFRTYLSGLLAPRDRNQTLTALAGAEPLGDRKSMKQAIPDRRVVRTRQALLEAFFGLVLERRYEEIKVNDIVERAGVSRSTLHEHFSGKDAILATSLRGPFSVLAGVIRQPDNAAKLGALLVHFWTNRAMARAILTGPMRQRTVAVLTGLIEQRLKSDRVGGPNALIIPIRLAAIQLAEALLAPVTAWLIGEARCSADALALALRKTAVAIIVALSQGSFNARVSTTLTAGA